MKSLFKGLSCKLFYNKYMITSIQVTNTDILAFIDVLVFTLVNCKALLINRKDNRNLKSKLLFKKISGKLLLN